MKHKRGMKPIAANRKVGCVMCWTMKRERNEATTLFYDDILDHHEALCDACAKIASLNPNNNGHLARMK